MDEKLLVIQTAFPGDAILTLPFIQKLAELFNQSEIDVVCIPSTAEIFSASPYVNEVIIFDKKNKHKSFLSVLKFAKIIKQKNYSRLYSPHRSFRTSMIVYLSGIKETTGFDNSSMNFVYKNLVKYENNLHEVQRNYKLLSLPKELKNWKLLPQVKAAIEATRKIDVFLNNVSNKRIAAVAPGSVWNTKIYPEEHYYKIIEYLLSRDFKVVLIGGKSDQTACESIVADFGNNVFSSAGKFSIIESIELLRSCEILICNDSAPTHMAMCADIPVITIYCSTVPSFGFYPYNSNSRTVSLEGLKCKPCGIHGHMKCPIKTFDCGANLLPESVIEKIKEIIS